MYGDEALLQQPPAQILASCPHDSPPWGAAFLTAFVALAGVYFLLGAAWQYSRGARAPRELLLNKEFWRELRALVADGVAFAQGRRGYQALSGEGGSAKQKKKEKKAKGEAVADKRRDKGSKKGKRDKREERADKKGRRKVMARPKKITWRARGGCHEWARLESEYTPSD